MWICGIKKNLIVPYEDAIKKSRYTSEDHSSIIISSKRIIQSIYKNNSSNRIDCLLNDVYQKINNKAYLLDTEIDKIGELESNDIVQIIGYYNDTYNYSNDNLRTKMSFLITDNVLNGHSIFYKIRNKKRLSINNLNHIKKMSYDELINIIKCYNEQNIKHKI
jgi:hypothetical protein